MVQSAAGLPDLLFTKGQNLVQKEPKKEPNSKTWGQKKGRPLFANLSAVTKSYETIISNLVNGMLLNHNCSATAKQVRDERS